MKVLVVGGSGFIGTWLVGELLQQGHEVRIFDLVAPPDERVPVRIGDIRDLEAISDALRGMDVVFHLAAEHRDDVRPVSLYWDVNVTGTENLARAAAENGVRRIVFTSTVAVYGPREEPADEDAEPNPISRYGESKLAAERVLLDWAGSAVDRRLVIVRPTVVFGEGNRGNIRTLIEHVGSGRFVFVGDGSNRKSMCYVANVAAFLAHAMSYEGDKRIFNYVDPPDLSMKELVGIIRGELGRRRSPLRLPYWAGLTAGRFCDAVSALTGSRLPISAARVRKFCTSTRFASSAWDGTSFEPRFTLEEGLRRTIRAIVPGAGDAAWTGTADEMAGNGRPGSRKPSRAEETAAR